MYRESYTAYVPHSGLLNVNLLILYFVDSFYLCSWIIRIMIFSNEQYNKNTDLFCRKYEIFMLVTMAAYFRDRHIRKTRTNKGFRNLKLLFMNIYVLFSFALFTFPIL